MKLRLAVATSSVGASARPFLDRHQLTGFFEVIVTGEEVERGKPAPDIYLRAADKLGLTVDACLVVEDALPGVAAAKAAKMRIAAIPDRRFVNPREYQKKADYVLSSLQELPALVRNSWSPSNHDARFAISSSSAANGVALSTQIVGQVLFHLNGIFVRHRVQMLV